MTLAEKRRQWEGSEESGGPVLKPLCVIEQDYRVLVVLQDPEDVEQPYHCHRYFKVGTGWEVSVDGQNVCLEAVWSWLNDPCARSTKAYAKQAEEE